MQDMIQTISLSVICISLIVAFFFGWYFYQRARNKERIMLIERGAKLSDIFLEQKKNKFTFSFPWLKSGVVTLCISFAFLGIGLAGDQTDFMEFRKPFIMGICLSVAMFVNHFISKKKSDPH